MTIASGGYLDTASSEPLHPAARETFAAALEQGYGDPRRLHGTGRSARLLLDNARAVVAECLGVRTDEVTFTSSGTDAVHRGLLGLLGARTRVGRHTLVSAVEHSAVHHALNWAQVPMGTLAVDRTGRVDPMTASDRAAELPGPLAVAALQHANHEVGTLQPVAEVAAALGDAPLFMDACASAGRVALPEGWSGLAASAHKWGGPAGVGVLVIRKGVRWDNPFPRDDRVDERASGFENVPAALAAAAALQSVCAEADDVAARQHALIARIRATVADTVPEVEVVGAPEERLPHLLTFSCLYVDGEALVTELDRHGFGVASGSACTSSTLSPSHVLEAMGVLTHGNVRLSLCRDTEQDEVDRFLQVLPEVVRELRSRVGMT